MVWFQDGLHFQCTGCGQCCTGGPGYVWLSLQEIEALAAFLAISCEQCVRTYIRQKYHRYALLEKKNYDCVFLKDGRCAVYAVRPLQCRTFPWWPHILSSPASWQAAALTCPGISMHAPLVRYEEIMEQQKLMLEGNGDSLVTWD